MSGAASKPTRWGVVIVSYNTAQLALDAALTALGDCPDARVVIVDNASPNNSMEIFQSAFEERDRAYITLPGLDHGFKPRFADIATISTCLVRQDELTAQPKPVPASLTVLRASVNNGFASGCNIGLRYLEETNSEEEPYTHFLLLNPDAIVAPSAFEKFEDVLQESDIGLCGATVLHADALAQVQALGGGSMNPVTLIGKNLGEGAVFPLIPERSAIEPLIRYPLGAAIALRADYLDYVGYLDERYFLYYEEIDWALSGAKRYRCGWAREAVVFHHYGASSNSVFRTAGEPSKRSLLSEYHMARSRFLFALKWRPWLVPLTLVFAAAQALRRVLRGRMDAAKALLHGAAPGAPRFYPARPR